MDDLISRQAALDIAYKYCPDDDGVCSKPGCDPREMLDEIEALPPAQPEERTDKRTETHACDCISRQAVIAEFSCCELTPDGGIDANYAIDFLQQLPSAQPEIIACGDCKHWICHDRRCGYWNHGVKPLDWCCHVERRTDE